MNFTNLKHIPFRQKIGIILLFIGIILIIFSLLADAIGLSRPGFLGIKQIYLILIGAAFLVSGALALISPKKYRGIFSKIAKNYSAIAVILVNTVLLILLFEFTLYIPEMDNTMKMGGSKSPIRNLIARYVRPSDNVGTGTYQYYPHVNYRHAPFKSKETNINDEGIRATPGSKDTEGAFRVFVFGGSTVYGAFIADWETLPAHLQIELSKVLKRDICVTNFGVNGWMTNQDVIMLMLELQKGNIPDLAIFYCGFNESRDTTWFNAFFGQHFSEQEKLRFPFINYITSLKTYKLAEKYLKKGSSGDPQESKLEAINRKRSKIFSDPSMRAKRFLANVRIVKGISEEYGFPALFFWQPIKARFKSRHEGIIPLVEEAAVKHKNLYYLNYVLEDKENDRSVWTGDHFHLTSKGNQIMAKEIVSILVSDKYLPQ